jgi:glycosyltransferase involved in cell wall biosynthesis
VPLRVGSGTRIKILEAFAHGVPVVATPLGAAGLGVTDGEQLLLAESPADFAAACVRLAADPTLRERLVRTAAAWVRAHHTPGAVARALLPILDAGRAAAATP